MRLKGSFVAMVLALAACKKKDAPAPPPPVAEQPAPKPADPAPTPPPPAETDEGPLAWVIHSGDGVATLRQKPTTPGKCYLECTIGDATTWSGQGACFGEKSDRKFLATDCGRTVVMIPAPPRTQNWRQAQVMRVYKKDKLDYPVVGIAALPDEKLIKSSPSWLKGCYGLSGEPPHYSSDNAAVEYEAIDGKKRTVPLIK